MKQHVLALVHLSALLLIVAVVPQAFGETFTSDFSNTPDRVWIGPDFWANPMEDWQVQDGRLECLSGGANRNVALLTRELGETNTPFEVSVIVGRITSDGDKATTGTVGFRIGLTDETGDYRAAALRGRGIDVGLDASGRLFIGQLAKPTVKPVEMPASVQLRLVGQPQGDQQRLTLSAVDPKDDSVLAEVVATVPAEKTVGCVALVNNHGVAARNAARWWFSDFSITGEKVQAHADRAFGPILWAMHSLSRGVMKMTAQMPPLGEKESQSVELQVERDGTATTIATETIDPDARTATFRVENWPTDKSISYRLVYKSTGRDGSPREHVYEGVVRREPVGRPLVVAGFTGNTDYVFPNIPVVENVAYHDPDVLFFSGDQIYENVGGYGIIRTPADRSILNYLRKWYLLGWAFGDLMRDRVTLCLPDDHDVYQGNVWGQGGVDCGGMAGHSRGGYAQPPAMVNAVHRTQTSHHPDPFDARPMARDLSVYYGDMVYGRVSFAVLADRMFKSGPQDKVNTWKGRPDHQRDPNYDAAKLDLPGLKLLGDRQIEFLEDWAGDWKGADLKVALSQTIFCNLANYHGGGQQFIFADLDSNAWPQSGRNRALNVLRKGFAFHLAGDQHLPSIVHQGTDVFGDSIWSFCVPSIAAGYPRSWRPDHEGRPVSNRVAGPNTGDYHDGFGNKMTVWAIGNPEPRDTAPEGSYGLAHAKSSGYGIVRLDPDAQTITIECWRFLADVKNPTAADQFPGWPKTINLTDADRREPLGHLPEISIPGIERPVLQVNDESTGQLVYARRLGVNTIRPPVYQPGTYTVKLGDPDTNKWQVQTGQQPVIER